MRLRFNKNRFKKVAGISVTVFSITVMTGYLLFESGLRFNLTPSLPIGVWKIDKNFIRIEKGDYVWFTPTREIADFGIQRGYLEENKSCPNYSIPLLKQVYGLPGDSYSFFDDIVRINNLPVENAKRRKTDSKGRPMPKILDGIVQRDRIFVLTLHSLSFDSRYFDTIPMENVIGTAKPVLVWTN
ncbi:MAG: conjugative transfer signal peptidase TraF [Proteobacteria bacterium]|nr:conjugative transfer signal peptidase TraF [Pseudomonadota bacterium]MBU1583055.1 conjugative transfer signal peptidase TraF [Pseudomonadota bacterium]MBU2452884.1 conjugative transfer signal peptidase TraF [Pseudomonadota bacterium]MBU2631673.1 conjugative transfer signal peptidase TraF [Pseudomonadota bacterium]